MDLGLQQGGSLKGKTFLTLGGDKNASQKKSETGKKKKNGIKVKKRTTSGRWQLREKDR